jgi:hypothetical protein
MFAKTIIPAYIPTTRTNSDLLRRLSCITSDTVLPAGAIQATQRVAQMKQGSNTRQAVLTALQGLTDEQRLIAGLDPLTSRDLASNPPGPAETMQQIGISKTNLDIVVRSFINRSFRTPRGESSLVPGSIKSTTTWTQLLGML